jgi:hypothetical protein
MFNKKHLLVPTALVLFGFLGVSGAKADDTDCYTNASLQGSYAIIGTYGSHVAIALGLRHFDGNGTGVITRIVTASNGVKATQMDDLLITGAVVKRGQLIATTLADAQRVPSAIVPGGIFLTRSYTRLPDRPQDPEDNR